MATNARRGQEASDSTDEQTREIPKATATDRTAADANNADNPNGRCENCGAWVDPEAIRVIGTDGTVPVCATCEDTNTSSTTAAVRNHHRDRRGTSAATGGVRR